MMIELQLFHFLFVETRSVVSDFADFSTGLGFTIVQVFSEEEKKLYVDYYLWDGH